MRPDASWPVSRQLAGVSRELTGELIPNQLAVSRRIFIYTANWLTRIEPSLRGKKTTRFFRVSG
jgi:hypothetical protein